MDSADRQGFSSSRSSQALFIHQALLLRAGGKRLEKEFLIMVGVSFCGVRGYLSCTLQKEERKWTFSACEWSSSNSFMDVGCNTLVYIYLFRPPKKFFPTFMGCLPEAWEVDIALQRIWATVREAHLLFVWDQTQMCRWSWVSCRWFQWAAGD